MLLSFLLQSYPTDCCGEHGSPGEETQDLDQNALGDRLAYKAGPVDLLVYKDKWPVDLVYKGPEVLNG